MLRNTHKVSSLLCSRNAGIFSPKFGFIKCQTMSHFHSESHHQMMSSKKKVPVQANSLNVSPRLHYSIAPKRYYSESSGGRPNIIARHKTCPVDLFRIQTTKSVSLREYEKQKAKGSRSFDLHLREDGKVHPSTHTMEFIGPNGMSLRPAGNNMAEILDQYNSQKTRVILIPANTPIPDDLVLVHEHTDHYSLQTAHPCTLANLNKRLTSFLDKFGTDMTPSEYFARHPIQ